ncbi:hypothetical protein IID19_05195 [Patescibacteria group bacterium]|nr:hypothetical protein [Patescibacteria group bacterium]
MENQTPQSEEQKPKKKSKKWFWIFGGFILLIIIIASAGEEKGTENKNTNVAPVATNTEVVNTASENENQEAESPTNEPIVLENTNQETAPPISEESVKVTIGRSEIINQFSDFEFNKEDPVDGEENYLGRSSNGLSMIQLIGSGDSLSQISIMNTMGPDSIDQWDTLDSYFRDLKNKLTPNMDPDFPKIELTNDTTNSDGFKVEYAYIDYGSSAPAVFSESYTFTLAE